MYNFEKFLSDINERKPYSSVITGDFNASSSSWWSKQIDTIEGWKFFSLTSSNLLSQLINEPTHIQTSSSSSIDLVFTNQSNLSVNSGAHASLHPNCHRHIVHSSLNLNIYYPLPYQRLIWDYKKVNSKNIQKALESVNWERLFDQKDINEQVPALNEALLNIFGTYVPNMYIIIDKDPVWMNKTIKTNIKAKNPLCKQYIQNGRFESDFFYPENGTLNLN